MKLPIFVLLALSSAGLAAAPKDWLADPNRPIAPAAALPASETAKSLAMPEGFQAIVFAAEPDVVQPIAYTIDDRGRLWVVENTNYPECPGKPVDKVLIFEDTNGDGVADKRTVFVDNLNFTSGIAVGFGGVWLGSPPNLTFIPVKDGDDKPAGPPQIVLDGWGNEDTHETLNDFTWGPDGWLYGTQGVFTNSKVGAPRAPEAARVGVNAGVWRYHPTKKKFELYCEGASNQWGLDWNDRGQAFFEACVIPHMWHVIQGARYQRQAGKHFNPYIYEDIKTIAWGRYEKAAYCGAMVYLGGAWPAEWRDTFFFHDIHMNKQRNERMERSGSGYKSVRNVDFIAAGDKWFRGLSPQYGPDGSVFINDWYDRVPCHQQREFTDRTNGRIYKIVYHGSTSAVATASPDLQRASDGDLVAMQLHRNDWYVRHARRILQERGGNAAVHTALAKILAENPDETRQLRALWALHATGGLSESLVLQSLKAPSEYVRAWTVQLACEEAPTDAVLAELSRLAKDDPASLVRLYVASAAQRIAIEKRWPILNALAAHGEDAKDQNLPLMLWYAAEPAVAADVAKGAELLANCQIPKVQEFITRRIAAVAAK